MVEDELERQDPLRDGEVSMTDRFMALFEHMQDGVALYELVCDAQRSPVDCRILETNLQFERLTGYSRTESVGKLASELYGPDSRSLLSEFCAVGMGGSARQVQFYYASLERHFNISIAPLGHHALATIVSDITLSKQQAEALDKSRLHQRALLDNQPHLAWLKDRDGRFLAVNRAFARACGQPDPETVVGKTDLDVWPGELANAYRADDEVVMRTGRQKAVDEEISGVEGTRWFQTYKSPVYAPDGSIVGTTGVSRDVTEYRCAVTEAKQAGESLEQYFKLSLDLLCIADADSTFVRVNPAWQEVLGIAVSELEDSKFADLVHPEDLPATWHAMNQLAEGRKMVDFRNRFRHADGSWRWLEWRSVSGGNGKIYAVARDVTRRHTDELALRAAERAAAKTREQLLSVSEVAHIGHFTLHLPSSTISWTPEMARIFDVEGASFQPTGANVLAMLHPADVPELLRVKDQVIETGVVQRRNFRIVRPSGEIRHCLLIAERGEDDDTLTIFGMVQDLTELRRAEEEQRKLEQQIMHAQKLESLGVLAGGIAHDFNNLLTSVLGNADLALSELPATNPACGYLEDIEKVSRRAADLCRQMLAYSGRGRFVVQPLALDELIRDMAQLLRVSISKKVSIEYDFRPALPSVLADPTQIRQVVMNLITNASEAIGDVVGVVALSTGVMHCDEAYLQDVVGDSDRHEPGQYVYFEVSDSGCGMSRETLDRIFDPFFTTKFTGRGLGLAAVMGIVRGHKGALHVHSAPGAGTTFRVLLPAHERTAQVLEHGQSSELDWRGSGLVLLADDEESIRNMGRHLLERVGFHVVTAADGREAVELFLRHHASVRLVILDLTMPHLDGEACLGALQRIDPSVRVIITSGYNEQDVVERFAGKGLSGFVQKPYKASDLLPKIRAALVA